MPLPRRPRVAGARSSTNADVAPIIVKEGKVGGVALKDGRKFLSRRVASCADCNVTFFKLLDPKILPEDFRRQRGGIDYTSATIKINVRPQRVARLQGCRASQPGRSIAAPSISAPTSITSSGPTTTPSMAGHRQSPILECTMATAVDNTLAPPGQAPDVDVHPVCALSSARRATGTHSRRFADRCFDILDEYAPNFKNAVINRQISSARRSGTDLRHDGRQYLSGFDVAEPNVFRCGLPRAGPTIARRSGPVSLRRGHSSRRRSDGSMWNERSAGCSEMDYD